MDEPSEDRKKLLKKHHEKREVCFKRPAYREAKWERAVKVYTINQESKYLLVLGIPTVGATKELLDLFALYGDIEEYRILHEYPVEEFTEAYWIKFKRIQSTRFAKKKLDNRSFFGGLLHVCYAPEFENENDTREKLNERRITVARKCKEYYEDTNKKKSSQNQIHNESHTSPQSDTVDNLLYIPPPPPPSCLKESAEQQSWNRKGINQEKTQSTGTSSGKQHSHSQPSFLSSESSMNDELSNIQRTKINKQYPRVPTNQATLPLEIQKLTAAEVYPNLETSYYKFCDESVDDSHTLVLSKDASSNQSRTDSSSVSTAEIDSIRCDIIPKTSSLSTPISMIQGNDQKSHPGSPQGLKIGSPNSSERGNTIESRKTAKRIVWNERAPINPFELVHQYTREPGAWNPYPPIKNRKNMDETDSLEDSVNKIRNKLKGTAEASITTTQFQEESPLTMSSSIRVEEQANKEEKQSTVLQPPVKKARKNDGRKRI